MVGPGGCVPDPEACACYCHTMGGNHVAACCWDCKDCGRTITHGERCRECQAKQPQGMECPGCGDLLPSPREVMLHSNDCAALLAMAEQEQLDAPPDDTMSTKENR